MDPVLLTLCTVYTTRLSDRTYVSDSKDAASNVCNSSSASSDSQAVSSGRANESKGSHDSASLAKPVSNPESTGLGAQEEEQPTSNALKNDPNESAETKRAKVEEQGKIPLDAADK